MTHLLKMQKWFGKKWLIYQKCRSDHEKVTYISKKSLKKRYIRKALQLVKKDTFFRNAEVVWKKWHIYKKCFKKWHVYKKWRRDFRWMHIFKSHFCALNLIFLTIVLIWIWYLNINLSRQIQFVYFIHICLTVNFHCLFWIRLTCRQILHVIPFYNIILKIGLTEHFQDQNKYSVKIFFTIHWQNL